MIDWIATRLFLSGGMLIEGHLRMFRDPGSSWMAQSDQSDGSFIDGCGICSLHLQQGDARATAKLDH